MKTAWIDGSAGASGDMVLGALIDVGVPIEVLAAALEPLDLGITLRAETVHRSAIGATKAHVDVPEPRTLRHLPDILELLDRLPADLCATAGAVFTRLAEAEASVHRMPVEQVHFHEVGALDCIADIVGTVAGFRHLGAERIVCSPLRLGSGHACTEHGRIPIPAPAVLELVAGLPAASGPAPFESTTPTGAALLVTLVDEWAVMPEMTVHRTGCGAGTRDTREFANVLRVVVGESTAPATTGHTAVQLDANVDDLDPRIWPAAIQAMLDAGAHDAWVAPITMKKGRPAFTVSALCSPERATEVRDAIFEHTSTIGLRESTVTKHALSRRETSIAVDGEPIGVKLALHDGRIVNRSVEWDDIVAAARRLQRSPKEVLHLAERRAGLVD